MAWTGNGISELAFSFVTDDSKSPQKTTILYGTSSSCKYFVVEILFLKKENKKKTTSFEFSTNWL